VRVTRGRWKCFYGAVLFSASMIVNATTLSPKAQFTAMYKQQLGDIVPCRSTSLYRHSVCSNTLRNEGNAPFMLVHDEPADKVVVLVHGLSDSPFFMREIAGVLFNEGFDVIAPLLPGHGLRDADDDMEDSALAERWQAHVSEAVQLGQSMSDTVIIGGFSTGGALSVQHYLNNPESVEGIMLFSGALALSENAESLSKIWGIKLLAKFLDGSYETHGPNPHKYPNVASFAGMELMDIIHGIREKLAQGETIDVPLFVAHSQADATTPIHGVEQLIDTTTKGNTFFVIDESYDLCHADLVVNQILLNKMGFNKALVKEQEACAIPKANPLFDQMAMMLKTFVSEFDTNEQ